MKLAILLIVFVLLPFTLLYAQDKPSTLKLTRTRINDTLVVAGQDTSAQKDLYDVIRSVFNKKGAVTNKGTTVIGTKPVFLYCQR